MEVLIIYSEADKEQFRHVRYLVTEFSISYIDCPVRNDEEMKTSLIGQDGVRSTHICVINPLEGTGNWWIPYAIGYGDGMDKSGRISIFSEGSRHTDEFPRVFVTTNLNELATYLLEEQDIFRITEQRELAKDKIIEAGMALSENAFAECTKKGDADSVRLYLDAGFSVSSVNHKGVPLIHLAIRNNRNEVFSILMEEKVDIDTISKDNGNTPIIEGVTKNNAAVITELLNRNCKLDIQNKNGQTALIIAVGNGKLETVRVLIKNHADESIADNLEMTAKKYAEIFNHSEIINLLGHSLAS